jgi:hypothetical protein
MKAHAGNHQGAGRVVVAEARHLQGVGHAAAGLLGKGLDLGRRVVVRHEHRVVGLELVTDLLDCLTLLLRRELRRMLCIKKLLHLLADCVQAI